MIVLLHIIFWTSALAVAHSYVFYPLLLARWSRSKTANDIRYTKTEKLPYVSVIMSVYNEAKVIRDKLDSLLALDYPDHRMGIYIGSDNSTDATNAIIDEYASQNDRIRFFPFPNRRGKPNVVNDLVDRATDDLAIGPDHIFLLTDASVMLHAEVLFHLVKHFKNRAIAVVDAHMQHFGLQREGISETENQYISREVRIKTMESLVWKKMIGPFGGCYAIRSDYFRKVPPSFLVDDFYITMRVLEQGGLVINDLDAICREPVSHEIKEEYRRKARISAGNFQNLVAFRHLWWPPVEPLRFAFFSHKILRWLGPFFLLLIVLATVGGTLLGDLFFTAILIVSVIFFFLLPILDWSLAKMGLNVLWVRSIRYFLLMNLALLSGFIRYTKGIKSNVWQPTKRN